MDVQQTDSQQTEPQNLRPQNSFPQHATPQHIAPQQALAQEQYPIEQIESLDPEEVPPKYRTDTSRSRRGRSHSSRGHRNTSRRSMPTDQSTLPSRGAARSVVGHRGRSAVSADDSPGFVRKVLNTLLSSSPKQSSTKNDSEQQGHTRQTNTVYQVEEFHEGCGVSEQAPISENDTINLRQSFQDIIQCKEQEWETKERQLQYHIHQTSLHLQHLQEKTRILEIKLLESESEKRSIREEHSTFIRKQQEASFRQMESARWLPTDESKVMDDLDRLKRDMRSWAKATSIKDTSLLQSLGDEESAALRHALENVVLFENGQFPQGLLATAKSPMLLLNALVAHSLYTSFFRSPFFFLSNGDGEGSSSFRPERILEDIYEQAQSANQQDAHMWRSQTLRLLMPPIRNASSDAEKQLRSTTEELISKLAARQSSAFLTSPACYLIDQKTKNDFKNKLHKIYNEAARLSYMLWTRRTEMRCFTLHELKNLSFDAESPELDPDALVRFEDHKDHLKDRQVTVMVHPLLKVYGNDEAKDYDQGRVWSKGVVWLDSKAEV